MTTITSTRVTAVLLSTMLALATPCTFGEAGPGKAATSPPELAHYPLAGDAKEVLGGNPAAEVRHVTFGPWGMELNGIYENGGAAGGFVTKFQVPALNFDSLSFSVDLVPEDFRPGTPGNGLVGRFQKILATLGVPFAEPTWSHVQMLSIGPSCRYLSLKPEAGGLLVTLDDGVLRFPVPGTTFVPRRWHRVIVSLDVPAGRLLVSLDGAPAVSSPLTGDWIPYIRRLSSYELAEERVFSFTDYSCGASYHGVAADLRIFGRSLSPAEMAAIAADRGWERRPLPPYSINREENLITLAAVLLILGLIAGLIWRRRLN